MFDLLILLVLSSMFIVVSGMIIRYRALIAYLQTQTSIHQSKYPAKCIVKTRKVAPTV